MTGGTLQWGRSPSSPLAFTSLTPRAPTRAAEWPQRWSALGQEPRERRFDPRGSQAVGQKGGVGVLAELGGSGASGDPQWRWRWQLVKLGSPSTLPALSPCPMPSLRVLVSEGQVSWQV